MLTEEEYKKLLLAMLKVDFIRELSIGELESLLTNLDRHEYSKGQRIVTQGEMGHSFFLLVSGTATVYIKEGWFGRKILAQIGPGDHFGEMALLEEGPRTASVQANETSHVFVLHAVDFADILMKNPGVKDRIQAAVAKRKKASQANSSAKPK